jgi:2,3-bisphosphoglycerate-independent phosphoglycerate mutase
VGHTGRHEPTIQAVAAVDLQVGRLIPVIERLQGALIVTADHGNADCMFDVDGSGHRQVKTSHTLNPVPLYIHAPGYALSLGSEAGANGLGDVAATLLHLLGYCAPEDYLPSLLA